MQNNNTLTEQDNWVLQRVTDWFNNPTTIDDFKVNSEVTKDLADIMDSYGLDLTDYLEATPHIENVKEEKDKIEHDLKELPELESPESDSYKSAIADLNKLKSFGNAEYVYFINHDYRYLQLGDFYPALLAVVASNEETAQVLLDTYKEDARQMLTRLIRNISNNEFNKEINPERDINKETAEQREVENLIRLTTLLKVKSAHLSEYSMVGLATVREYKEGLKLIYNKRIKPFNDEMALDFERAKYAYEAVKHLPDDMYINSNLYFKPVVSNINDLFITNGQLTMMTQALLSQFDKTSVEDIMLEP